MANRPQGRKPRITGEGKGIYKRGSGLGTGPVGNKDGYSGRPTQNRPSGTRPQAPQQNNGQMPPYGTQRRPTTRASGGGKSPLLTIIIIAAFLIFGGAGLSSLFGNGEQNQSSSSHLPNILPSIIESFTGGTNPLANMASANVSGGWTDGSNTGKINKSVDSSALRWTTASDGTKIMTLPEEQWELVQELEKNVFVDDGEGYIDLGLDNMFEFTEDGDLIGEPGTTWLAIDGQPVAYYYESTVYDGDDSYSITGRVPAMINGVRADLIIVFDSDNPDGYIAGAKTVYSEDVTSVAAKNMTGLSDGDKIDFICDYYNYDGTYEDSYFLGDPYTVNGTPEISDVYIDSYNVSTTYRFTDIYRQNYWTPTVE